MIVYGIVALAFSGLIGWLWGRLNQVAEAETELQRRAEYQALLEAAAARQAAGQGVPGGPFTTTVSAPPPGAVAPSPLVPGAPAPPREF